MPQLDFSFRSLLFFKFLDNLIIIYLIMTHFFLSYLLLKFLILKIYIYEIEFILLMSNIFKSILLYNNLYEKIYIYIFNNLNLKKNYLELLNLIYIFKYLTIIINFYSIIKVFIFNYFFNIYDKINEINFVIFTINILNLEINFNIEKEITFNKNNDFEQSIFFSFNQLNFIDTYLIKNYFIKLPIILLNQLNILMLELNDEYFYNSYFIIQKNNNLNSFNCLFIENKSTFIGDFYINNKFNYLNFILEMSKYSIQFENLKNKKEYFNTFKYIFLIYNCKLFNYIKLDSENYISNLFTNFFIYKSFFYIFNEYLLIQLKTKLMNNYIIQQNLFYFENLLDYSKNWFNKNLYYYIFEWKFNFYRIF